MPVHRSAPASGKRLYRRCRPQLLLPGARSVGASLLCWNKSPDAKKKGRRNNITVDAAESTQLRFLQPVFQ